jgi:LysM repeat protein
MVVLQQFATQTALAASGQSGTPAANASPTLGGATNTPQIVVVATNTPGTPALPSPTPQAAVTLPAPTQGPRPTSYTLQQGEFPYCIARRFNVNPDELLSLNGLSDSQVLQPGLALKIPQSGNTFPGPRALKAHPAAYTVGLNDTIYSVACLYGDVDPMAIAANNGLASPYTLKVGQTLNIP